MRWGQNSKGRRRWNFWAPPGSNEGKFCCLKMAAFPVFPKKWIHFYLAFLVHLINIPSCRDWYFYFPQQKETVVQIWAGMKKWTDARGIGKALRNTWSHSFLLDSSNMCTDTAYMKGVCSSLTVDRRQSSFGKQDGPLFAIKGSNRKLDHLLVPCKYKWCHVLMRCMWFILHKQCGRTWKSLENQFLKLSLSTLLKKFALFQWSHTIVHA